MEDSSLSELMKKKRCTLFAAIIIFDNRTSEMSSVTSRSIIDTDLSATGASWEKLIQTKELRRRKKRSAKEEIGDEEKKAGRRIVF